MIKINRLIAEGLLILVHIYTVILIARIILSWFVVGSSTGKAVSDIYRIVFALTEPLLQPMRKIIPTVRMGMGHLDLSPLVLLILLRIAQNMINRYLLF